LVDAPSSQGGASDGSGYPDSYSALVSELVLPALRGALVGWEPRAPEPLLAWLDVWERALPPLALAHVAEVVASRCGRFLMPVISDQCGMCALMRLNSGRCMMPVCLPLTEMQVLVMPALRRAVLGWEPRSETVPIHAWLHPWLALLGARGGAGGGGQLEELYPIVRGKLAAALQVQQPLFFCRLVLECCFVVSLVVLGVHVMCCTCSIARFSDMLACCNGVQRFVYVCHLLVHHMWACCRKLACILCHGDKEAVVINVESRSFPVPWC
jgi:hypothetical protein